MLYLHTTRYDPGHSKTLPLWLATLLLLAGCGGIDTPTSTHEAPVGLWSGKILEAGAPDSEMFGMVSPGGRTIFLPGLSPFPANLPYFNSGLNADKTSGDIDDDLSLIGNGFPALVYEFQGNYQARKSLTATLTRQLETPRTIELVWDPRTDNSASLARAAGTWTDDRSGTVRVITITPSGQLSGNDSIGCIYDGKVFEPAPNVNVYTLQMDVSGCFNFTLRFNGLATLLDTSVAADTLLMASVGFSPVGFTKIGVLQRQ